MLDAALGYPTTTDTNEGTVCADAPPARAILEVEILDGHRTRFGDIVVKSRNDPMFAMARKLIEFGHAPETIVRFRWALSGTQSVKDAPLRVFAALTVEENDRGIRFRPYRPSRLWGVAGKESREAPASA
jgi:hypothetical protein